MWSIEIVLLMLLVGSLAGLIAGLFGVGGGLILVPVVLWVLQMQGLENEYAQHIAIGTSFAVMVFTSFSSAYSQYKKQSIDWKTFQFMSMGVILGTALGAVLAPYLPTKGLQVFFVVFATITALRTLLGLNPKPSRQLPSSTGLLSVGSVIGVLSSWVGIGGGSMTVPFLTLCNMPIHRAVGTSAALGWPIALAGTVGYVWSGSQVETLPSATWGFVYLPAVIVLSIATIITAPLGVKLSHQLSSQRLKQGFGVLLLLIAARMLWKVVTT